MFMGALMLLHVVLASEGFVADRAVDTLFACMLFAMAGGMARGSECRGTVVRGCIRAGIFVLLLKQIGGCSHGGRRLGIR